jgi:hypothetical protein
MISLKEYEDLSTHKFIKIEIMKAQKEFNGNKFFPTTAYGTNG